MHRSHLPLRTWFLAAHLMATHSNGISALQLQAQLGIGSYRSAWLLLRKLRRAMVDPDRSPLQGIAEVDEASVPCRDGGGAEDGGERGVAGRGRGAAGRLPVAGAVELSEDGSPRRIRLETVGDYGAEALRGFIAGAVEPGAWAVTDGWSGYIGLPDNPRERRVVGGRPAHEHPCLESSPDPAFLRLFCGFSRVPCPAVPDLSTAFPTGGAVRARRRARRGDPGRPAGDSLSVPDGRCPACRQAAAAVRSSHTRRSRRRALAVTPGPPMTATGATLWGFPLPLRRSYSSLMSGERLPDGSAAI